MLDAYGADDKQRVLLGVEQGFSRDYRSLRPWGPLSKRNCAVAPLAGWGVPSSNPMELSARYPTIVLTAVLWAALLQANDCDRPTGDTTLSLLELDVAEQNQVLGFASGDRAYDVWTAAGPNTAVLRAHPTDLTANVVWFLGTETGSLGIGGGEVTLDLPDGPSFINVSVRPTGGAVALYNIRVNPACGSEGECDDGNECTLDAACDLGTGLCPPPTPVPAQTVCDLGSIEDKLCDGAGECAPAGSQQWGVPRSLEANGGDARYPRVAVDAMGNAVAVWQQPDLSPLGYESIWASRFTPATGWGPAEILDIGDGVAESPQVAVDPSGNAIAVWQQSDGTRTNLWANHYSVGVGWGGAILIELDDTGDAELPLTAFGPSQSIGIDAAGNAMVAWLLVAPEPPTLGNDLTYNAVVSRYTPSGGWEAQVHLSGNASDPQIGVDASGNAIALWRLRPNSGGGGQTVYASNYTAGSGWGPFPLFVSSSTALRGPRMAVDSVGNAVVAWSSCGDPDFCDDVFVNRYAPATGWEGEQVIFSDPAVSQTPAVAINDAGDIVVAWMLIDSYPTTSLWARRYTGGAWQGVEQLDSGGQFGEPTAAIDAGGNAIVAWGALFVSQGVPAVPDILASRYVAGAGWEPPTVIEANGAQGNALFPHVAYGADGSAMLLWGDGSSATERDIWAIRVHP